MVFQNVQNYFVSDIFFFDFAMKLNTDKLYCYNEMLLFKGMQ